LISFYLTNSAAVFLGKVLNHILPTEGHMSI